jgi:hypothetical protein
MWTHQDSSPDAADESILDEFKATNGLYTSSLFKYAPGFLQEIDSAI